MVKKCANSHCGQPFLSARHGRIYSFPHRGGVRHYWLCFICCRRFRVVRAANGAVRLQRLARHAA